MINIQPITVLVFLLILSSCAGMPKVKDDINFDDIKGEWEATGFYNYNILDFNDSESTFTTITYNRQIEEKIVRSIKMKEGVISLNIASSQNSKSTTRYIGYLIGNRLVLTKENSNNTLIFLQKDEISELRKIIYEPP